MKYKVTLHGFSSATYDVEAESPKEAYEKILDKADLADAETYEWDAENPGDVENQWGNSVEIADL